MRFQIKILLILVTMVQVNSQGLIVSGSHGIPSLLNYHGENLELKDLIDQKWRNALNFFESAGRNKIPRQLAQDLATLDIRVDYSANGLNFLDLNAQEASLNQENEEETGLVGENGSEVAPAQEEQAQDESEGLKSEEPAETNSSTGDSETQGFQEESEDASQSENTQEKEGKASTGSKKTGSQSTAESVSSEEQGRGNGVEFQNPDLIPTEAPSYHGGIATGKVVAVNEYKVKNLRYLEHSQGHNRDNIMGTYLIQNGQETQALKDWHQNSSNNNTPSYESTQDVFVSSEGNGFQPGARINQSGFVTILK